MLKKDETATFGKRSTWYLWEQFNVKAPDAPGWRNSHYTVHCRLRELQDLLNSFLHTKCHLFLELDALHSAISWSSEKPPRSSASFEKRWYPPPPEERRAKKFDLLNDTDEFSLPATSRDSSALNHVDWYRRFLKNLSFVFFCSYAES